MQYKMHGDVDKRMYLGDVDRKITGKYMEGFPNTQMY